MHSDSITGFEASEQGLRFSRVHHIIWKSMFSYSPYIGDQKSDEDDQSFLSEIFVYQNDDLLLISE